MVAYNYKERGLNPIMLKPRGENRDGEKIIKSRIGLSWECLYIDEIILDDIAATAEIVKIKKIDCIIVDEVQFATIRQIEVMQAIVEKCSIPVICYGLREDFLQRPFDASRELCARADVIEELKTVCWCGQRAKCNARVNHTT